MKKEENSYINYLKCVNEQLNKEIKYLEKINNYLYGQISFLNMAICCGDANRKLSKSIKDDVNKFIIDQKKNFFGRKRRSD